MKFVFLLTGMLLGLTLCAQSSPQLVKDINPGSSSSIAEARGSVLNGQLIFAALTDAGGEEVWISDGTAAGTRLLADIVPGEDGSAPNGFITVGDQVFFAATTPEFGTELYRTDGTTQGTRMVADILPGALSGLLDSPERTFGFARDTLLFAARGSIAETELWRSDGTAAGTYLLKDIEILGTNSRGSLPRDFHSSDNLTYFTAESGADNRQIWRTDGTEAGTVRVSNFRGATGITLESMAVKDDVAYFGALSRLTSYDLYRLGPTDTEPLLLFDFNGPGMDLTTNNGTRKRFAFLGDRFIFAADINNGADVYVSDGTPEGTRIIDDLPELGGAGYAPQNFVTVGNAVYYSDATPADGVELWRTDGTQLGTFRVRDIIPGPDSGITPASRFHEHLGQLYFGARGTDNNGISTGSELYVSDGTSGGTNLVSNINPGGGSSFPKQFVSNGNLLMFYANNGNAGEELFSISAPAALTATLVALTPVSCFGGNDGSATYNVSGGTTATDGTGGVQTISNLSAGPTTRVFNDGSGNSVTVAFTIEQPSDFRVMSSTAAQTNQSDGAITVSVSGATPPYRFQWSDGPSREQNRTGLEAGTYTLTITDANNCTTEEQFTIDDERSVPDLTATIVSQTPVSCFGSRDGTITLNVSGGTSDTDGTGGVQTIENLQAGETAVIIRDMSGNSVRVIFSILGPPAFTVSGETTGQNSLAGGSITLIVSGATPPYRYTWADGPSTDSIRTGLTFGDYTVTISDANDCTYTENFRVDDLTSISTLADAGIKVYPTLAREQLTIESEKQDVIGATIYSMDGRRAATYNFPGTTVHHLDVSSPDIPPGTYVIRLQLKTGNYVAERFIKTR